MSRLSRTALSKRSVTLLFAGALFIAGISAWGSLKQELLPDIDFPVITVVTPYPGAGSSDVTEQITKPIENAISGIPRLELMQSTSSNSISLVVTQFSFGTNVKETTAAITEAIAKASLPATAQPTVQALNINASPVVVSSIASTGSGGLEVVAEIARTEIVPEIEAIEGVARADLTGGLEQRIFITLDPTKMAAAGITSQQVVGILQANNLTLPSGQLSTDGSRTPVSTIGTFTSIDQIRNLVVGFERVAPTVPTVPAPGASPVASAAPAAPAAPKPITLGDLGTVEPDLVATTGFGRTNGDPALTLTVSKASNANTVEVADAVQAKLAEIGARHKSQLTITTVADLSVFIKESADGLVREGGLGAIFAILTIFLFLFSLRATIVAAISIPLSILTALVIMQLTGVTINIMTLGGLAVAVGRVVDDAIVVLENIYRHRALGEDRLSASINGPREVAGAITASTLTTVAVFLPLGFVGGLVSQFFLPFALTVTFALLASLVCALTVVPVLAYFLIRKVDSNVDTMGEPKRSIWVRIYTPIITFVLRGRATKLGVIAVAAILFFASLALAPLLPTQFINAGSEKTLVVTVSPPTGASSAAVLERTIQAETILLADPDVKLVQTSIPAEGDTSSQVFQSALQGRAANSATMTVQLKDTADVDAATVRLTAALEPIRTDGYDATISSGGGFSGGGLNVIVTGQTRADVDQASVAILDALADQPDLVNLKSDLVKATPEVQVTVDPNKAITVGMTAAQVAGQVRAALVAQPATSIQSADGRTVQVVVQLDPKAVASVDDLKTLPVGTVAVAPLGSIATVEQVEVQGSITRIDQRPAASITAEIASDDTGAVSASVQSELDALAAAGAFPPGTTAELAGVSQQQSEAFGGLFASMGVAVLLVYVMMVLTFNSLVTPFVILFTLPLATIGAFPALLITGRPIGVSALIGFLMLIGIVVTNAIVYLDLVERLRSEGHSTKNALIEGGRTRVRPILMTAIATILALIPLAAGFNEGSIIAAELGTVVIGGLFSATFLTLVVIPVVYSLVDSLKVRVGRAVGGRPIVEPPAEGSPAG